MRAEARFQLQSPRWQRVIRIEVVILALLSLWTFVGTLVLTRQFADHLRAELLNVVTETVQPKTASVWLRQLER